MRRVLLDNCVPHYLRHEFAGHTVETAFYAGLHRIPDGELIGKIN